MYNTTETLGVCDAVGLGNGSLGFTLPLPCRCTERHERHIPLSSADRVESYTMSACPGWEREKSGLGSPPYCPRRRNSSRIPIESPPAGSSLIHIKIAKKHREPPANDWRPRGRPGPERVKGSSTFPTSCMRIAPRATSGWRGATCVSETTVARSPTRTSAVRTVCVSGYV